MASTARAARTARPRGFLSIVNAVYTRGTIMNAMLRAGLACCLLLVWLGTIPSARAADPVDFARDVQPLLQKHCLVCHGSQQQMSGLRLDQKDAALKGGASGQDIKPGDSAGSRLIRLVTGADGKVMPPVGARLTAVEIATLRAWID